MLSTQQDENNRIYSDYRQYLKPLIAEIESLTQEFPTGILNEIRSCFDHISRSYADENESNVDLNIDRARGHLKRAQLDCYKMLIVYFHDDVEEFKRRNRNKDWSTVDGGRFNLAFHDLVGIARLSFAKSKTLPDSTSNWEQTCLTYRAVIRFLNDPKTVLQVNEGKSIKTWKDSLFWCIASAILGYALGWIRF